MNRHNPYRESLRTPEEREALARALHPEEFRPRVLPKVEPEPERASKDAPVFSEGQRVVVTTGRHSGKVGVVRKRVLKPARYVDYRVELPGVIATLDYKRWELRAA